MATIVPLRLQAHNGSPSCERSKVFLMKIPQRTQKQEVFKHVVKITADWDLRGISAFCNAANAWLAVRWCRCDDAC
jgi:hypothetical protein